MRYRSPEATRAINSTGVICAFKQRAVQLTWTTLETNWKSAVKKLEHGRKHLFLYKGDLREDLTSGINV